MTSTVRSSVQTFFSVQGYKHVSAGIKLHVGTYLLFFTHKILNKNNTNAFFP